MEYGLTFYRNQPVARYERGEIPAGAHLLVTPERKPAELDSDLRNRRAMLLGAFPSQKLEFYWISAKAY